jgi:hypothetical protein
MLTDMYEHLDRLQPIRLDLFAQDKSKKTRIAGIDARRREEEEVPRQVGEAARMASFPLALRLARFLDPDGATRVEAYWSPEPGALLVERDAVRRAATVSGVPGINILRPDYHLQAGLRLFDDDGLTRSLDVTQHPVPPAAAAPGMTIPVKANVVTGLRPEAGPLRLAFQCDQHLMPPSATPDEPLGPLMQRAVVRHDTLRALPSDPGRLTMSDLRPMLAPPGALAALADPSTAYGLTYPFGKLLPDAPLALYFEVYHLAFDAETDRTRYRVSYEVTHETRRGALRRLLGPDTDEAGTTTTVVQESGSRRTQEFIALELGELELAGEGGILRVQVTVADEVSGQTVARALAFDLLEDGEPG